MYAIDFFARNPALSGLDCDSALFTICKELIENATDACKSDSNAQKSDLHHSIKLELRYLESEDRIQVRCMDDGCGIDCELLESIGEVFSSTKSLQESFGTFGLGLKTVLAFAHNTANGCLSISMRVSQDLMWKFQIALPREDGIPYVRNIFTENVGRENWPWSTEVVGEFRCPLLDDIVEWLYSYVSIINIHNYKIRYGIEAFGKILVVPEKKFERQSATKTDTEIMEDSIIALILKGRQILSKGYMEEVSADRTIGINCFMCETHQKADDLATLYLMRCVNGIPLLESSSDSCAMFGAIFTAVKKKLKQFGIKAVGKTFKHTLDLKPDESISCSGFHEHRRFLSKIIIRTAPKASWDSMLLCMNVVAKRIEFGDIRKTYITDGDAKKSIMVMLPKLLANVKLKLEQDGKIYEMESSEAVEKRLIAQYCEHLSDVTANIIAEASAPTVSRALKLLGLNENASTDGELP